MNIQRDEENQNLILQSPPQQAEEQKINQENVPIYDATELNSKEEAAKQLEEGVALMGLKGTPTSIAQQTALLVLAIEFTVSALASMLLITIEPLGWILKFIPLLDLLTFITYVLCLFCIQFFSRFFITKPMNQILFITHMCSRSLIFVFFALWLLYLRLEVFYVFTIIMIFWILYSNKDKEEIDVSVKGNFMTTVFVGLVISLFLVMLTRSNWVVILIMPAAGLSYIYFLLLAVQQLEQLDYILENNNGLYLGAAQIDSNLIFFCSLLCSNMCSKKKEPKKEEDFEQQKVVKSDVIIQNGNNEQNNKNVTDEIQANIDSGVDMLAQKVTAETVKLVVEQVKDKVNEVKGQVKLVTEQVQTPVKAEDQGQVPIKAETQNSANDVGKSGQL